MQWWLKMASSRAQILIQGKVICSSFLNISTAAENTYRIGKLASNKDKHDQKTLEKEHQTQKYGIAYYNEV